MRILLPIALLSTTSLANLAGAEEKKQPIDVYVGAEYGLSFVHTTVQNPVLPGIEVDQRPAAWAAFFGVRPVKNFGLELGRIDFGQASRANLPDGNGGITNLTTYSAHAITLQLAAFVPLFSSKLDLFAKSGIGKLNTDTFSAGYYPEACRSTPNGCVPLGNASLGTSHRRTDFVYGLGTQYHFGKFGIRAEFQSFDGSHTPRMFGLGATWKF